MAGMRIPRLITALAACGTLAMAHGAIAQDAFDACAVFTQDDAEKVLATQATGEAANPKAKRPRVVTSCTYTASANGKPLAATAQFKVSRNNDEAARAFDEARLQLQTKPMLISGAEAFWAGKAGQMHVRKGKIWMTLTVGSTKVNERDIDQARKLAEVLVKKL